MNETDENSPPPKYRWPWFVAAALVLGLVMAVLFVLAAVKKVEQQRDFTPLPASAPTR